MSFIFFAWVATILYGLEVFVGKFVSKHTIKNPWLYNFIWALFIAIIIVIISLFNHAGFPKEFTKLILATFFYTLAGVFYILSLYGLDVSILSPFFNIRIIFSVILAGIFLHEVLNPFQYLLIGVLFVCGVLLTMDDKFTIKSFFKLPVFYALITMVSISFMGIFLKESIAINGYWETNLWVNVLGIVMLLPTIPLFKKSLKTLNIRKTGSLSIIAILGTIATLAANRAYANNVSITSVILSIPVSMILVVTFSLFKPHVFEHNSKKVYAFRFALAIIMIIAALKLSS